MSNGEWYWPVGWVMGACQMLWGLPVVGLEKIAAACNKVFANQQISHTLYGLTTLIFEHINPFTSGDSLLGPASFLNLATTPPMHRLLVHYIMLLFLHHADRT
jgi:hypothetical protein